MRLKMLCVLAYLCKYSITTSFLSSQSFTAPLQGFLNALVYGWTREDFMRTIAQKRSQSNAHGGNAAINSSSEEEEEDMKDSSVRLFGS